MRSLTPEEAALWARVASTIRPLSRAKEHGQTQNQIRAARTEPKPIAARAAVPAKSPQVRDLPGTTLDSSWDRRLRSGSIAPERVVDLHGMSLDRAWRSIDDALDAALRGGERVLLLITGHQRSGEPPVRRGAIRAAVHDWLAASRHAGEIAAVRGAHLRHGGGGSLYIVLRKPRAR